MEFSSELALAGKPVGEGRPVFVIAEAGVAHFGSLEKAFRLVDLARSAGADAVKFQIFRTDELVSAASPEWRDRLRSRELPPSAFREIRAYCDEKGIPFCATAHDEPSLDALDSIGVPFYKIGSGELRNWRFVGRIARRGKPVVLSTGMYALDDVAAAVRVFEEAGNADLVLLHCVTLYPTPAAEVNLRAMEALRDFGAIVGYSDHTAGFHVPLAAVARGARVLEKHITLDFDVPNAQDWKVSCGPHDFGEMLRQLREVESSLGAAVKAPRAGEAASVAWAAKSLVATRRLSRGETVVEDALAARRPGTGIPPSRLREVVGRRLATDVPDGALLAWDMLE